MIMTYYKQVVMKFINSMIKYICYFFIIFNIYCSESRVTNIQYTDEAEWRYTLFHLHNEDLSKLGLKCNNSNELLENIKKLVMNGDVYIYSGEHDEEDIEHYGEDATSAEGRKELIDQLEEILKINKFCVYDNGKDFISLNTDTILITNKPSIVPYNLNYDGNYYSENIEGIISRNFGRYKNFPEWKCDAIKIFLKCLENENNQRIFPEKVKFGIYTIVFNKNGEQKLLQINDKDDDLLINTYTNVFVTFPSYCYGINIVYNDPKEIDFSDNGLKPFKIPEVCLIKEDELKDEKGGEIDDETCEKISEKLNELVNKIEKNEIENKMENKIENEIKGKDKDRIKKVKVFGRNDKTKPEHKKISVQDEKKCCNSTKSCRS